MPFETTNTLAKAPSTTWEPWGVTVLAGSENAGPEQSNDHGIRSCYARTAEGALYALANGAAYCTDSRYSTEAMGLIVAKGPGHDAAVEAARDAQPCQPSADLVRGYRVASYDGTTATITLAIEISDKLATVSYQLIWEDGDWKFVVTDDGGMPLAPSSVDDLDGFTVWGHHAS